MNKLLLGAAAMMAAIAGTPALAGTVIYDTPGTTNVNQNWSGLLGLDFQVNNAIHISDLGAFDGAGDGINTDIFVAIFDSAGDLVVNPVNFNGSASSGSDYIFKSIGDVVLGPGTYQLTAWGYGTEGNYNAEGPGGAITFDNLGGALTALGSRYGAPGTSGALATIVDNGTTRYGAGSFIAAVPEPATWAMMIFGFGMIGFAARRKHRQTVRVTYA